MVQTRNKLKYDELDNLKELIPERRSNEKDKKERSILLLLSSFPNISKCAKGSEFNVCRNYFIFNIQ